MSHGAPVGVRIRDAVLVFNVLYYYPRDMKSLSGVGRSLFISWPSCRNDPAMTTKMACFFHVLLGMSPGRSTCHARVDVVQDIVGVVE
jgi:hypothetical protein